MNKNNKERRPFEIGDPEPFIKYNCPPASSGDMTGLIPSGASESECIEAYNRLYPYLADDTIESVD